MDGDEKSRMVLVRPSGDGDATIVAVPSKDLVSLIGRSIRDLFQVREIEKVILPLECGLIGYVVQPLPQAS